MSNRILIAQIATTHGVKGLVKLRYFGEDVADIETYNPLFTSDTGHDTITLHVKNAIKGGYVAEVNGITDRNNAEKLRGLDLYIDESAVITPDSEDEFLPKDLIGCEVFEADQKIGKVIAIDDFGAGDLLDIQQVNGQTFYLPFKDEFILEVDIKQKIMTVSVPDGLRE